MRSPPFRPTPVAAAAAVVAAVAALVAGGASLWAPGTVDVVNLGDSYSAAIGTGAISPSPLLDSCHQGEGPDHVSALGDQPGYDVLLDLACSGATTTQVRRIASRPAVDAALAEAELVTLTLGGNDVGWTRVVVQCSALGDPALCETLLHRTPLVIHAAAQSAGATVAALAAATDGTIVVLGYPHLFDAEQDTAFISAARAARLNALSDQLNAALESAVEAQGAVFVDVTERFAGHGVGSRDPWIHFDPAEPLSPNSLHPTSRGYRSGYFAALTSSISSLYTRPPADSDRHAQAPDRSGPGPVGTTAGAAVRRCASRP